MLDWKKRESLLSKFLSRKHTYHQDFLSFCSFVYNNYLFLCSSVENSAFQEIYGVCTGYVAQTYPVAQTLYTSMFYAFYGKCCPVL